jgi:hypothetical protein
MDQILTATILAVVLFFGILLLLEVGRRIGERRLAQDPEGARIGTGVVEGAVFALIGLLIAFTFSGAASRFDDRRDLVVEETNAIGTAYLRLDLLPEDLQPQMRELFRRYLDARIAVYRRLPDLAAAMAELEVADSLQGQIWRQAVAASRFEGIAPDAVKLLLPALNDMIDITTVRTMAARQHPPSVVFAMLVVMILAGALFAGYGMAGGKSRNWLHSLGFALVISVAVYIIIDLEYPRLGLIQVDDFDQALVELRETMR